MRTRIVLAGLVAAAVAVSPALAAKKKDTYELKGTLSAYLAPVGPTPGSITILVSKANHAGDPFVGQSLVFSIDASTKIKMKGGAIADGDKGDIQLKGAPGLDATGLQALTPKQINEKSG